MALGRHVITLGHSDFNDYLEASQLNLSTEHFPFPCSLLDLVLDRYDDSPEPPNNANAMDLEELLGYLQNTEDFELSPWMAVLTQTEAIGDPALPTKQQSAILRWLGQALETWESQFPMEEPLAGHIKRIKPVAAALAITEPNFLQPGAHPIHQLLDAIQGRAIGWQSRLDRVGTILEQQVTTAVDSASTWFDTRNLDVANTCSEFVAAAERDQARAQRMIQRVVETEVGKVKTAAAKLEAARMINALLEKYQAPAEIGEFIRGPWYSSAQLLLLKFSHESEQWQNMSTTTETLLDSLQPMEDAEEERQQYIFEVVTQLPKEMRRWLLSLHHDTEAVNEAMGLVEFAHLRILRRQPLTLAPVEPISVAGNTDLGKPSGTVLKWEEGQWFSIDTPDDGVMRMQLVLKVEREEQLLFTNLAGIKVLQLNFTEFAKLVKKKKVTPLFSGVSFSRCLANAAGIKTTEMLDALTQTQKDPEEWRDSSRDEPRVKPGKPELELVSSQELAAEPEMELSQGSETEDFDFEDLVAASGRAAPDNELLAEENAALESGADLSTPENAPTTEDDDSPEPSVPLSAEGEGFLADQSKNLADEDSTFAGEPPVEDAPTEEVAGEEPEASPTEENPTLETAPDSAKTEIDLPTGTWLGFHDGETPLMARLAVHDPDEDQYIFVNRKGVKLRKMTGQELLDLIDQDLVDILETKSNFREEVNRARKDLDE